MMGDGRWRAQHRGRGKRPFRLGSGTPPHPTRSAGSLTPRDGKVAPRGRVPALGHCEADGSTGRVGHMGEARHGPSRSTPLTPPCGPPSPRLGHDLPQHPHSIIVAHVLKVDIIHLEGLGESRVSSGVGVYLGPQDPKDRTCSSMSPGSMRPSAATAPPFMMEPM
jgi:hypothetical protein